MNENNVTIVGIVVVGAIAVMALWRGQDGVLVTGLASLIGGLVGGRAAYLLAAGKKSTGK